MPDDAEALADLKPILLLDVRYYANLTKALHNEHDVPTQRQSLSRRTILSTLDITAARRGKLECRVDDATLSMKVVDPETGLAAVACAASRAEAKTRIVRDDLAPLCFEVLADDGSSSMGMVFDDHEDAAEFCKCWFGVKVDIDMDGKTDAIAYDTVGDGKVDAIDSIEQDGNRDGVLDAKGVWIQQVITVNGGSTMGADSTDGHNSFDFQAEKDDAGAAETATPHPGAPAASAAPPASSPTSPASSNARMGGDLKDGAPPADSRPALCCTLS